MRNNFLQVIFFLFLFFCTQEVFAQVTVDVSVSAQVGSVAPISSGGSSGGDFLFLPETSVRFSGLAYPFANILILEDGKEKTKVLADERGIFSATFAEDFDENILYSIYAVDTSGIRSILLNYPLVVRENYLTHLSGIRFPPTILTDKAEVKRGDFLTVSGFSFSESVLDIFIEGGQAPGRGIGLKKAFKTQAKTDGTYKIVLPLLGLEKGEYVAYVKYADDTRISKLVRFVIGENNLLTKDIVMSLPGDCNSDDIINLIDFSVLAFWYQRPNPPLCVDINKDKIVNLVDFSILAFYWTG